MMLGLMLLVFGRVGYSESSSAEAGLNPGARAPLSRLPPGHPASKRGKAGNRIDTRIREKGERRRGEGS
jgi:hypothetical protein